MANLANQVVKSIQIRHDEFEHKPSLLPVTPEKISFSLAQILPLFLPDWFLRDANEDVCYVSASVEGVILAIVHALDDKTDH